MVEPQREQLATRVFEAESFVFVVRSNDDEVCRVVEALFADLPVGSGPAAEFVITRQHNRATLHGPDPLPTHRSEDPDSVIADLVTAVNRQMLDAGSDRLHLHAGMVSNGTATVVISAASGHGKTTVTTQLALSGWTYLTDEAVSLVAGERSAQAFPKPVSIKPGGFADFPAFADQRATLGSPSPDIWNVALGSLGVSTATAAEPTLVVILTRTSRREVASWEPVTPADAVVYLVEQSLDSQRYDGSIFVLAELCARCRCVRIDAGSPESTAALVERLAAEDNSLTLPLTQLSPAGHDRRLDDVIAVGIGDELVLHNTTTQQVISLNPAGTQTWNNHFLRPSEEEPPTIEELAFIRRLTEMGFADGASGGVQR